jgi:hypothetical protein
MKYSGELTIHFEQGCGSWPQFHDDRGLNGENNEFWSWDHTINFIGKLFFSNIKIYDNDSNVVYDGPMTFSKSIHRKNIIKMKESDSEFKLTSWDFYSPTELHPLTWKEYCIKKYRCEIETDLVIDAFKN